MNCSSDSASARAGFGTSSPDFHWWLAEAGHWSCRKLIALVAADVLRESEALAGVS